MTIVGATYKTILNRFMLQSCQLCDVAHDFQYDARIIRKEALPLEMWAGHPDHHLQFPRVWVAMQQSQKTT